MRGLITFLVLIFLLFLVQRSIFGGTDLSESTYSAYDYQKIADKFSKKQSALKAQKFTDSLRPWLRANGYSTSLFIVADMSLSMNIKRFYIVNPDSQKLLLSSIVSHGSGGGSSLQKTVFSNQPGSFCTSRGRYKIGESYYGNYGKAYRMHGLDASNSNAMKRLIVLHAYRDQTNEEYGNPYYFSGGCPMLSQEHFAICDSLIQKQTKPVMMVIY